MERRRTFLCPFFLCEEHYPRTTENIRAYDINSQ